MSTDRTAGFFTFGVPPDSYHLPHPPLGLPVILLIRRVLLRAFELLREQNFGLGAASEDEITAALRRVIQNNLRESGSVAGFSKHTYESLVRQGQWENFNGSVLTKTPDLFFKLRDDNSEARPVISEFDGLFIECKSVDGKHPVGSKYCDDGLIRFVRGDYAWAMPEGMMLAYVRGKRTIAGHLIPAMSEPLRLNALGTACLPSCCSNGATVACAPAEAIHKSSHRRAFNWRDAKGPATDICIYHLWHQCD
jgi:hypothetical protein